MTYVGLYVPDKAACTESFVEVMLYPQQEVLQRFDRLDEHGAESGFDTSTLGA